MYNKHMLWFPIQSYFYSVKTIMRQVFLMSVLGVLEITKIIETKGTNQTNIYIPGKYLVNNYDEVLSVDAKI